MTVTLPPRAPNKTERKLLLHPVRYIPLDVKEKKRKTRTSKGKAMKDIDKRVRHTKEVFKLPLIKRKMEREKNGRGDTVYLPCGTTDTKT